MPIRPKDDDEAFGFVATNENGAHVAYMCIVRPSGAIFIQTILNDLVHTSFHLPKTDGFADCHYRTAGDLVKSGKIRIDADGPDQKLAKWKRKVADRQIERAMLMIFPGQFCQDTINLPDEAQTFGIDIENFTIPDDQTLTVEFLFGPQDDAVWDARFKDYGIHQWYRDLATGERFCLNFFFEERDYGSYVAADDHVSVKFERGDKPDTGTEYTVMFGPGWGRYTMGMLHGTPRKLNRH